MTALITLFVLSQAISIVSHTKLWHVDELLHLNTPLKLNKSRTNQFNYVISIYSKYAVHVFLAKHNQYSFLFYEPQIYFLFGFVPGPEKRICNPKLVEVLTWLFGICELRYCTAFCITIWAE